MKSQKEWIRIKSGIILIFLWLVLSSFLSAQEKELTWEELREQFECPAWSVRLVLAYGFIGGHSRNQRKEVVGMPAICICPT